MERNLCRPATSNPLRNEVGVQDMNQYKVVLTCEDDEVHLTRGMQVDEDQLAPDKLERWLRLGVLSQIDRSPEAQGRTDLV